ncbi:hypothetical protein NECAME_01368 [Necator americanus]|uniref:Uncharacterized protein n=1 Tax=Necator americanus TaxID=51031 RepID=W2TVX3_NECAM|nr:hypothetical protein NECAME_01368 [Necator americanus]ETN86240.1 hypothetical protein NECAME_01368 [Necator americanus]
MNDDDKTFNSAVMLILIAHQRHRAQNKRNTSCREHPLKYALWRTMFIFVLGLVSIAGAAANPLTARSVCANPPRGDDKIRKAFLEGHNKIRQELATGGMHDDGGALPGSTSLFMLYEILHHTESSEEITL